MNSNSRGFHNVNNQDGCDSSHNSVSIASNQGAAEIAEGAEKSLLTKRKRERKPDKTKKIVSKIVYAPSAQ
jgi:hypothetical protein